jgi:uncharacterized protein involved in cysteine biosynthesis
MSDNFFIQFIQRLFKKNPKFFQYITFLAGVLAVLSGTIQLAIHQFETNVPGWLSWLDSKTLLVSSIVAWVIARLPNPDKENNPNG